MEPIRILIVEDDRDWRRGLAAYLAQFSDLDVCAQAETGEEALAAFEHCEIDVVLMDIMLANSAEGIWLTAEVTENWGASVIMLTSLEEKESMFEAFQAGAVDYLVKTDFERIPAAIRSAFFNRSPISPEAAEQMRAEFRRLKKLERDFRAREIRDLLTPTELEILKRINDGMTQSRIADDLVISIRTVKVHVGHILRKLGTSTSKEAVSLLREHGIIE